MSGENGNQNGDNAENGDDGRRGGEAVSISELSNGGGHAPQPPTEELRNLHLLGQNGVTAAESCDVPPPSRSPVPPSGSFEATFRLFAKFGDPKSDGRHITLSNSDKWMRQAKVIDGKRITTTDTAIHFKKLKAHKVPIADYRKFVEDLAAAKKLDVEADIRAKMAGCGPPGHHGAGTGTPAKVQSAVERLTDTTKYTGTHKQRFDETGKGRGIAGRKDLVDNTGYVHNFQNRNSFVGKSDEP